MLSVTTAVQSGAWDSPSTWSDGVPDDSLRAVIPASMTVTLTGDDHVAKELVVQGVLDVAESPGADKSLTANWIHVNSGGVFQIGTEEDRYDEANFIVTIDGQGTGTSFNIEGVPMPINNNNAFLMAAGGGRLQFFGGEKLTFTKLAATAEVGANQILVESAIDRDHDGDLDSDDGTVDWQVGDEIVIASSTRDYSDEEVRFITAISDRGDGTQLITLDAPLANRHYGEVETYGEAAVLPGDFNGDGVVDAADYTVWRDKQGWAGEDPLQGAGDRSGRIDDGDLQLWAANFGAVGLPGANPDTSDIDLRAEVAALNRTVRFQGLASQDTDNSFGDRARFNAGLSTGFGAHTMIMPTAGQITIDSVQFDRMGQTARQGRYPIHWHLGDDRAGDILRGASITNSNNRGVTVHGTSSLLIEDVVLHDIHGHGFFMEDGVETGNWFRANIAFGIHKVGRSDAVGDSMPDVNDPFIVDTHDFVAQNPLRFLSSSAYWITNPDNFWVGNVSAGVDGTGFWFILPEFALGESALDPQYANVNANETPLGLFDHNKAHSSHVGFNMDRGMDLESAVGAELLNNSFGRAYQPENASGQQVEPVFSNLTVYKTEIGVYQRGRYGQFDHNKYADNFTSTFITFSQRITDSLYVGHSRGNADLSEVVTGQSLYDGPNFMDGTHFAGFNRGGSAHVFRNHGGALRNTHVYVSDTSYEEDGTKEQLSISERYGATYNANRDAFDFQAPTAIYDVDGTLTGHGGGAAGSVLVPDNNFITDADDVRPAGWDARISDDLYANFRIEFEGNNQGRLTLTTPDGASDTESQSDSHRTILKANNEVYTVAFPDGTSSYGDGFEILYRIQLGNTNPASITESSIIRFQGVADDVRVLDSRNRFNGNDRTPTTQVASLAELESVGGPAYWIDGDDLVVKFVTVASESIRYFFTPGSNTPIDPTPSDALQLSASDDAYLQGTFPVNNTLLRVESSPSRTRTSYLKFDVPDTAGQTINAATLQLTVSGDAGDNMRIRVYEGSSDDWTESTLSPASAPVPTTLLDEITGSFVIGQTFEFDVSGAVASGSPVTFVVDSDGVTSGNDVAFASSEDGDAAIRPMLVVELDEPTPVVVWDDPAPPSNTDGSAITAIADPFGTARGTIGRWITNGQNQYHNANVAGPSVDVSAYDGMPYTFSFDYYVESTQPLSDDVVYQNVYDATNFLALQDAALDTWVTHSTTGTIDVFQGSTINPLIIVNHQGTTSAIPSFYIDNILFTINPGSAGASEASVAALAALSFGVSPSEVETVERDQTGVADDGAVDEALLLIDLVFEEATENEALDDGGGLGLAPIADTLVDEGFASDPLERVV